jgi:hypothetical protein
MPLDRQSRNELADILTQWLHGNVGGSDVVKKIDEILDRNPPAGPEDWLLGHACVHCRLSFTKHWDDGRIIVSQPEWNVLCDTVVALRSDLEAATVVNKHSIPRWIMFCLWTTIVVGTSLWAIANHHVWGYLVWCLGPLPYLIWALCAWGFAKPRLGPSYLHENDSVRFQALRKTMVFPPYDAARFKPSSAYVRDKRKQVIISAFPVLVLFGVFVLLWPFQVAYNLTRHEQQSQGSSPRQ